MIFLWLEWLSHPHFSHGALCILSAHWDEKWFWWWGLYCPFVCFQSSQNAFSPTHGEQRRLLGDRFLLIALWLIRLMLPHLLPLIFSLMGTGSGSKFKKKKCKSFSKKTFFSFNLSPLLFPYLTFCPRTALTFKNQRCGRNQVLDFTITFDS